MRKSLSRSFKEEWSKAEKRGSSISLTLASKQKIPPIFSSVDFPTDNVLYISTLDSILRNYQAANLAIEDSQSFTYKNLRKMKNEDQYGKLYLEAVCERNESEISANTLEY